MLSQVMANGCIEQEGARRNAKKYTGESEYSHFWLLLVISSCQRNCKTSRSFLLIDTFKKAFSMSAVKVTVGPEPQQYVQYPLVEFWSSLQAVIEGDTSGLC